MLRFTELTNVKEVGKVTEWFTRGSDISGVIDQMVT